jgi:signal transduction histidine kinase
MALRLYRQRVWLFLASILIPAAVYGFLGVALYRKLPYQFAFYASGIALALAVTLFCRFVVWQDYRREARTARLQSEFVARVSHELRTPLTSIRVLAETLDLDRVTDPERRKNYLRGIVRETDRLTSLVDNILDFSGVRSRGGHFRETDLTEAVESAAAQLRPSMERDGYSLEVISSGAAPTAPADGEQLRQAVLNLLTNACKYSGDSRRIEVRVSRSRGEARISVADWGIGVPPEYRSRIFESFVRVPGAHTEGVSGVGLGLALVSEIMRAHNGRVEVQDNRPAGSVFSLVWPARKP